MKLETLEHKAADGQQNPALLFVHGAWHGAWCWAETFLPYFAQQGYDSYAVSLRGHGQSELEGKLKHQRIKHYVEDVMSVVNQLNRPLVLIGHSMGGFVVQHCLATQNPNLKAGILVAPVPPTGTPKKNHAGIIPSLGDTLKILFTWSTYPLIGSLVKARAWFFSPRFPQAKLEAVFPKLQDESFLVVIDMMGRVLPDVSKIKVPILVIGGSHDAFFSPDDFTQTSIAYGGALKLYVGKPHNFFLEEGWETPADDMIAWLTENA
jgi:pimeloyl-ACP methyl ester carboxylesterase